jgi:hypothetical protein
LWELLSILKVRDENAGREIGSTQSRWFAHIGGIAERCGNREKAM